MVCNTEKVEALSKTEIQLAKVYWVLAKGISNCKEFQAIKLAYPHANIQKAAFTYC